MKAFLIFRKAIYISQGADPLENRLVLVERRGKKFAVTWIHKNLEKEDGQSQKWANREADFSVLPMVVLMQVAA